MIIVYDFTFFYRIVIARYIMKNIIILVYCIATAQIKSVKYALFFINFVQYILSFLCCTRNVLGVKDSSHILFRISHFHNCEKSEDRH